MTPVSRDILGQEFWLLGRLLNVQEYIPLEKTQDKLTSEKERKIFVGGIPITVIDGT